MESLPHDWIPLVALVFTLGLKHGLDADHLVAIDGLAQANARENPGLARWCGFLFSLGHGAVVMLVALAVGLLAHRWAVPGWLGDVGAWVSIGFLFALGGLNLAAVWRAAPDEVVRPVGLKARLLGRVELAGRPLAVALVGMLFALSFDTMSQAAFFAVTATRFGGWANALALGFLFTLGMVVVDGCNGLWINHLIRRSDQIARRASRVFALVISGLSLAVGAYGVACYVSPTMNTWSGSRHLGFAVLAVVAAGFLSAAWLSRAEARKACATTG